MATLISLWVTFSTTKNLIFTNTKTKRTLPFKIFWSGWRGNVTRQVISLRLLFRNWGIFSSSVAGCKKTALNHKNSHRNWEISKQGRVWSTVQPTFPASENSRFLSAWPSSGTLSWCKWKLVHLVHLKAPLTRVHESNNSF